MPTNSAISAAAIPTVVAIMPHSAVTDGLCARSIRMSGLTASGQAALIRVHPRFICSNGQKRTASRGWFVANPGARCPAVTTKKLRGFVPSW